MKRYAQIAKLNRLMNAAKSAWQHDNAIGYERELEDVSEPPVEAHVTINDNAFEFDCGRYYVKVFADMAHGFRLTITGECDEYEVGEVFSKFLNEEV